MKLANGIFLFLAVFFAAGVAMHFALFSKPGVFVWSVESKEDGGTRVVRTPGAGTAVVVNEAEGGESAAVPVEAAGDVGTTGGEADSVEGESGETVEIVETGEAETDPGELALFNGADLGEWRKTQFGGEGDVFINEDGNLEFGFGAIMTGVHWGGEVPRTSNYEIELDAMKLDGNDFFCALTFPVGESFATFVVGGWGGGVVGISCVDDLNASENETMNIEGFENDRWYKIRVRVTDAQLSAWIDDTQMVDLPLEGRKISLLPGDIELSVPVGIASFITRAQYRNITWRNLPEGE